MSNTNNAEIFSGTFTRGTESASFEITVWPKGWEVTKGDDACRAFLADDDSDWTHYLNWFFYEHVEGWTPPVAA